MILLSDGTDRLQWAEAHHGGVSGSTIPKAMTPAGRRNWVGTTFFDSDTSDRMQIYFDYGHRREDEFMGEWIDKRFNVQPNHCLFGADINPLFMATPDGWNERTGDIAEFKTSTTPLPKTIKREHRDQMQWNMMVMESGRCLYVHEQHDNFVPVDMPLAQWVERDDERIAQLVEVATGLIFQLEMERN